MNFGLVVLINLLSYMLKFTFGKVDDFEDFIINWNYNSKFGKLNLKFVLFLSNYNFIL